jgi:oligosaccharide repeat unit polymerase
MELLIGFRGKFFVQIVVLWFIRNLKTGKKFNLVPLLSAVLLITVLSVAIVGFREQRESQWMGPLGFVSGQGISLNVTELAVENRSMFDRNTGRYLIGLITSIVRPNEENFPSDLSLYLNPVAYSQGFATGSSYLAEAYLLAGVAGVLIASVIIGYVLSWMHGRSSTWKGAVLVLASLGLIIYMPRGGLLDPVTGTVKQLLAMVAAFALALGLTIGSSFLPHRALPK